MKKISRILGVILMAAMAFSLVGCSGKNTDNSKKVGYQLDLPAASEEIAVVTTSMGEFKLRFFPEAAPKAVENFKTHAQNGYYNGVIFHRIIENFMVQTGDPTGTGRGGESIWGGKFDDEFSDKLFNITGAVAMANAGANTNGSQFFINDVPVEEFKGWDYFQRVYDVYSKSPKDFEASYGSTVDMSKLTDEIKALYENNSGNPHLDASLSTSSKGYTVFAQVFEGMDTIEKISKVEVDSSDRPLSDVTIEKIELVPYEQ